MGGKEFKTEYELLTEKLTAEGRITVLTEEVSSQILQEIYGPDPATGEDCAEFTANHKRKMAQGIKLFPSCDDFLIGGYNGK